MNNRRNELLLVSSREYCKCVVEGKTIKYNQLVTPLTTSGGSFYGLTYNSSATSGLITISGTASYTSGDPNIYDIFGSYSLKANHKYIIHSTSKNFYAWFIDYDSSNNIGLDENDTVATVSANGDYYCIIRPSDLSDFDGNTYDEKFYIMLIDLTELGLDNITSASDFFATDLGKYILKGNYLSATSGAFIQAKTPIIFKGVNIWNEKMELGSLTNGAEVSSSTELRNVGYIKVIPNTKYYAFGGGTIFLSFYDSNKTFIEEGAVNNDDFTTPNNCYYMRFRLNDSYGTTYNHDICINEYNENYNGKYYKYCGTNALMEGLTLQKGDKYKTYSIDNVSYNELLENQVFNNISTSQLLDTINLTANHKYIFIQNYSRQSAGYDDTDYQVYFYGTNVEEYNINLRGNFIYTASETTSCDLRIQIFSQFGGAINFSIMLIDLTLLGLDNITSVADFNKTKLGMFLSKGYHLPYTTSNKTIKDQLVRTMVDIVLDDQTWTRHSATINRNGYYTCDISSYGIKYYDSSQVANALSDKCLIISQEQNSLEGMPLGYLSIYEDTICYNSNDNSAPNGHLLVELATPALIMWQTLDIQDYNEFVSTDTPNIFKLNRDLSDYGVLDITSDSGTKQTNLLWLNIAGANGDFCYQDGYIYQKTNDIESAWIYQIQISNAPSRMVSRRTINVESDNGVDLDFTKE